MIINYCYILIIDMKMKQILFTLALLVGIGSFLLVPTASAEICNPGPDQYETNIIPCMTGTQGGIWGILQLVIDILTAGIGIAAVGGIIYGAVLYSSAGGSAEQTKKAKDMIRNIVIGLITYSLMFAILNFIIPGGLI